MRKLYSFDILYKKNKKSSYRILLDDGEKTLLVTLEIYNIKELWYLDVKTDNENLHMGQRINAYEDLFLLCRRRYKEFPNVKMIALPINLNGFDVEFTTKTAGILQDIMVVV